MTEQAADSAHAARLASAFSTVVFRDLARQKTTVAKRRLANVAGLVHDDTSATLADAFNRAHAAMWKYYRNEYIFKNALISKIVFGKHSPRTASALLEIPMGASCADLIVLNGTITIYEIKTDLDQFDRVASQVADYSTRAEHVTVVVSESRANAAESRLPAQVGILTIRQNGALRTIRPSVSNLHQLNVDHLFQLLRTEEALRILQRTRRYELDVPTGYAWPRMREIFAELPVELAHKEVLAELHTRGQIATSLTTQSSFPISLRALAYATDLSQAASRRLLSRLNSHPSVIFKY